MIGWAIYPTPEEGVSNAFDWMMERAAENGITLRILFAENFSLSLSSEGNKLFYNGEELALPHFVLMRHYDYNLSMALEQMGVRVVNDGVSMALSQNKFLTHLALLRCGLPTPKTLYRVDDYACCVATMGTPFIMKAVRGSKGLEVYLIHSEEEFMECRSVLTDYIVQCYIASSCGRDLRVWVVGNCAIASVLRHSESSFKSNIALGAKADSYDLSDEVAQLAVESCRAVGLELGGVDILFDGDGYTVCEVNGNAGFRAFGLSGKKVDIPQEIFHYIFLLFGKNRD